MVYSQENSYQKELLRVKELRTSPRYIVHRNKQKWNILCFQNFFNPLTPILIKTEVLHTISIQYQPDE